MGFLARALVESKNSTLDLFREIYGSRMTKSGRTVSVDTAIRVSAVFACNRVIGNGMAQVPLKLMREAEDGKSRLPARDDRRYRLLAHKPNRWQTSFQYRQMASWHTELTGNHYSFINQLGGKLLELYPLMPNMVEAMPLPDGGAEYKVTSADGKHKIFPASSILHFHGPTWDGISGIDIVRVAAEAIGLAQITEESTARLHRNGIRPSGMYSVDGILADGKYKELSDWLDTNMAGAENAGKPFILDRAAKWVNTQMSGIDAQALETRNHQIAEICRFHGVNPIMAGYTDKAATYASAEQMFLAHLQDCLAPRWTDYEQVLNAKLLTPKEQEGGLYFNFVEEGMARASLKDTKDIILGYVNGGIMTPNEGRAKLDLNPSSDPIDNKLRVPVNVAGAAPAPASDPKGE